MNWDESSKTTSDKKHHTPHAGGGGRPPTDLQATLIAIACGDQKRASQAIKRIFDKNSNASIKQDDLAHLSTARLKVLSHTSCWD
jgi:hypothetical protein